jgi:DNA-directed RNA polymerase beta subunit
MHEGDYTLEDSSIITEDLSNAMATDVTMLKSAYFEPNTNVLQIVKKGQHIKSSQPLILFEHSFENADTNKMLDNLDDDFTDYVEELGRDKILSKYSGEVVDIKVYYNIDFELLSESLQRIVSNYAKSVNKRKNIIKNTENKSTIFPPTEKINNTKLKGKNFEGVLIEFYVRHEDKLSVGDKVVYNTAIKTIVSDVIPSDESPYSERYPDEKIEAIFSPLSVVSRMTTDTYPIMYTNKLIIEMKRKMKEIWESN